MLFNSYLFISIFMPCVLLAFFGLARLRLLNLATFSLIIASLVFYAYWDVRYLPLLAASVLFNHFIGGLLERTRSRKWLTIGVTGNLTLLGYFKYTALFVDLVNRFLHSPVHVPEIVLPLGISFFTFTQIAYLVDAWRGETNGYSLLHYSLFVTFFPHLIAGPILYHANIIPQFKRLRNFVFSHENMARGITIFGLGLFKKVVVADYLATIANPVFEQALRASFFEAWIGTVAYAMQLYFDFSGYSEMAIGLGLMLNIDLPVNFNTPYRASSIIDFWRRWHITLSAFLKNYLYIPLGGNRGGERARLRNLMITMLLGGLWHGAGWTFVIWGGLHGAYLVINHTWRKLSRPLPGAVGWPLTFIAVLIAWVFFRAHTVHDAWSMVQSMVGWHGVAAPRQIEGSLCWQVLVIKPKKLLMLAAICTASLTLPDTLQLIEYFKPNWRWAAVTAALFLVSMAKLDHATEFLYYQF